jgi:aminoglycoside phosphotransferase (APT) family kinase protein
MLPDARLFETWLRMRPGFADARVTRVAALDGGVSNITCRVDLAGAAVTTLALRVQRERGIFEPYDVIREGEVIRRLEASAIPVPKLIATEPAHLPLGAPFIVLEWIDAPHMGEAPGADFGAYLEALVAIHTAGWQALGLAEVLPVPASPGNALLAEIDAIDWRRERFEGGDEPLLVHAGGILRSTAPADGELALCQGDINVFNYRFRDGKVAAVVDWEQARISDPRSDLGQMMALRLLKGAPFAPAEEQPFVQAYAAARGIAVTGMAWFRARWVWELGVIYHGWRAFSASAPWYTHETMAASLRAALDELSHG